MPRQDEINVTLESEVLSNSNERSQFEIDDLIGISPGWLLRSGITMVAIVSGILMLGAYFFKYPDVLYGSGTVTSKTPPIEIVSRSSGYIDVIQVEEGSKVDQRDPVLLINNTTDVDQLVLLQDWIKRFEQIKDPKKYLKLDFVYDLQLGIVQAEYANLQLKFNEFQQTLKDGVVFQQINNLTREIDKIKSLNESQKREKDIFNQELDLSRKNFKRNEELIKDGSISVLDVEQSKTSLLQNERQYEGMNNTIIQNNIRIEQLKMEKLKLKEQRSNKVNGFIFSISEIIARIRSAIENWNETYIIEAPIGGRISFNKEVVVKKNLKEGDIIGHVIPHTSTTNYVSAIFSNQRIGKIKKGQKVILKFDAFPHKEYGVVMSTVKEIGKLPELNTDGEFQYELIIPLEDVIITDYKDTIPYNPQMTVSAEVITKDLTIFDRLFNQILSLSNRQS